MLSQYCGSLWAYIQSKFNSFLQLPNCTRTSELTILLPWFNFINNYNKIGLLCNIIVCACMYSTYVCMYIRMYVRTVHTYIHTYIHTYDNYKQLSAFAILWNTYIHTQYMLAILWNTYIHTQYVLAILWNTYIQIMPIT